MTEPKGTLWAPDPHTLVKHEILRGYLQAWYPIMAHRGFRRVIVIDGFAGPGRYDDGKLGSPLLMLSLLIDRKDFRRLAGTQFVFCFVESRKDRFDRLEQEIKAFQEAHQPWPENVKIVTRSGPFVETAEWIAGRYRGTGKRMDPTFAFIDPFGIKGLPLKLLADLLEHPGCELFVNFMINPASRFAPSNQIDPVLDELYGCRDYTQAEGLTGAERISFLRGLYAEQLRKVAGFPYVQSFGMRNRTGNILYDLVFATRSVTGLEKMKAAMWKADPSGNFEFSDRKAGWVPLFIDDPLDLDPLRRALLKAFAGRTVTIEEIERYTIVETPYLPTHLRKNVLTPWEKEKVIQVSRPGKHGFPAGTRITFSS